MRTTRCRAAAVVCIVLVSLLAACSNDDNDSGGGGGGGNRGNGGSPSAPTPAPASTATTVSQVEADRQRAQRIVLTAADLPGFTVDTPGSRNQSADLDAAANACVNNNALLVRLGEDDDGRGARSPRFSKGEALGVGSGATFGETDDEARSAIAALSAPTFTGCFSNALAAELRKNQTFTNVAVTTARLPTVGAGDQSIGFRSTAGVRIGGRAVTFYFDFTFLRTGRAVAVLSGFALGTPFPEADRTALAATLAGRMAG